MGPRGLARRLRWRGLGWGVQAPPAPPWAPRLVLPHRPPLTPPPPPPPRPCRPPAGGRLPALRPLERVERPLPRHGAPVCQGHRRALGGQHGQRAVRQPAHLRGRPGRDRLVGWWGGQWAPGVLPPPCVCAVWCRPALSCAALRCAELCSAAAALRCTGACVAQDARRVQRPALPLPPRAASLTPAGGATTRGGGGRAGAAPPPPSTL